MTKVSVFGQTEKDLKKIELVSLITERGNSKHQGVPADYLNVVLVCKNYSGNYDLIHCFDDNYNHKTSSGNGCFLGHWNDGVV